MYKFLSRTVEVESVVEPQGATKRGPRKQLLATLLYPANKFSEFISEKKVPRSKSVIVNMNPLYDSFYELMFSFTAFWIIATSMTFVCAYSFRNSFLSLIILTFDISFFICFSTWKVVSATFLLVCFVCLNERICETRKHVLYFTSKTLFVLEIIKF